MDGGERERERGTHRWRVAGKPIRNQDMVGIMRLGRAHTPFLVDCECLYARETLSDRWLSPINNNTRVPFIQPVQGGNVLCLFSSSPFGIKGTNTEWSLLFHL